MQSVRLTISNISRLSLAFVITGFLLSKAQAQVNSPFTRYGIGELYSTPHAISRAMGGLSAAYSDGNANNAGQSVNFQNPATYGSFYYSTLDLGVYIDSRNLTSKNPSGKFGSTNFLPAYLAVGVPLNRAKGLGLAIGLKPVSRIGYSVQNNSRAAGDSLQTLYEGEGGVNQAFIGVAKRWKGLSIGFNTGYNFGNKDVSTKKNFINDTVFYYSSSSGTKTHFGGMFFTGGLQYEVTLSSKVNELAKTTEQYHLRFGLTGTIGQTMNATADVDKYTFTYNTQGEAKIDSVAGQDDIKGSVYIPGTYAAGITLHKTTANSRGLFELWSIGMEYTATNWTKYRFYDQTDQLADSWQFKLGIQFAPDPLSGRNFWNSVNYRLGAFMGKDYLDPDGKGLKLFGVTFGAGLPVRKFSNYTDQVTMINTAFQFGKRGSAVNNVTETYFAFVLGFSLSDLWFVKRKYD
jgi:hypothetical protein